LSIILKCPLKKEPQFNKIGQKFFCGCPFGIVNAEELLRLLGQAEMLDA
jgi:hypothetical protein